MKARGVRVHPGTVPERQARVRLSPIPRLKPLAASVRNACLPAGLIFTLGSTVALAGPEGGQVVGGQGSISKPDTNTTNIHQQSHNMAIDWSSYNVKKNETVNYHQPSKSAHALNRIYDQNPSQIYGSINANGRVTLVNPNGIFFGPSASVNVNSLIASGHDISVEDFMNGRLKFNTAPGQSAGAVVNQGLLQAATGGSINLIGGSVRNEGLIVANAGQVNLAAGDQITMDFDGDGLIRFSIDREVLENAQALDSAVSNTGEIIADGGTVMLSGRAAQNVFSHVVNNEGIVRAGRIENRGGKIVLAGSGASQSSVINTGTIDASARDATSDGGTVEITADTIEQQGIIRADSTGGNGGSIKLVAEDTNIVSGNAVMSANAVSSPSTGEGQGEGSGKGGSVHVLGDKVALLDNTTIDVSGELGGGEVLIGGDYQGKNPDIRNAVQTFVGADTTIRADAAKAGDGGRVIVWADELTRFNGEITARGGQESGNGGFVETSGKQVLQVGSQAVVDARAPAGIAGEWLLDPSDLTINDDVADTDVTGSSPFSPTGTPDLSSNITTGTIESAIGTGTSVTITTVGSPDSTGQNGDITILDPIDVSLSGSAATLTFEAEGSIISSNADADAAGGTITETGGGNGLSVVMRANETITIGEAITTSGGSMTLSADHDFSGSGGPASDGIGNIVINAAVNLGSGSFIATALNGFFDTGTTAPITAGVGNITATGGNSFVSDNASFSGGLTFDAGNNILNVDDGAILTLGANSVLTTTNLQIETAATSSIDATGVNLTIVQSDGAAFTLGGTGQLTGTELDAITAGSLDVRTTGDIAVDGITATQSGGISGLTTLDAANVSFVTGASVFANALRVLADNDVTANVGVTVNSGTLTLFADDDISGAGAISGAGTLTASTIDLDAATGISASTAATTVTADNTTSGNVSVSDTDGFTISGSNADGGSFTAIAGGSGNTLTVGGGNISAGTGSVALQADEITLTGTVTGNGGVSLNVNTAGTAITLGSGTGGLNLSDATLGQVSTTGTLTIGGNSESPPAAGAIAIDSAIDLTGDANNLSLLSGSGITFAQGSSTGLTAAGTVTLNAAGAIAGQATSATDINADTISLISSTSIGATDAIQVAAATQLNANTSAGNGNIVLESSGAMPVGVINAGTGNVTLTSGGAITDTNAGTLNITANLLSLNAAGAISSSVDLLDIDVTTLTADTTASAGTGIFINETDDVAIGAGDITTLGGDVELVAAGAITGAAGANIVTTAAADSGNASGAVTINTTGAGSIDLAGDVVTFGADYSSLLGFNTASAGGEITITTANGAVAVTNINTSGGDATGTADSNGGAAANINITAGGNNTLTLNGNLTARGGSGSGLGGNNGVDGTITLNSGTGSTANQAAGTIDAAGLELLGGGSFTLTSSTNDVETLAGLTTNSISYRDTDGFDIGTVNTTVGLDAGTNVVTLQNGAVVTQSQTITASGLELLGSGSYTLTNTGNDVTTLAADLSAGALSFTDANAFNIGTINTTTGIKTVGRNVVLAAGSGISSSAGANITTTAAADSGVASGTVELDVTGTGGINLAGDIITTGAGNIAGTASAGGQVNIDTFDGDITIANINTSGGDSTGAGGDGGAAAAINITAGDNAASTGDDITLGTLTTLGGSPNGSGTAGAAATVTLNSSAGGAVIDGNGATANVLASSLVADARDGVGNGNALETTVASIDIDNSASGNIEIAETDGLTVTKADQATDNDANGIIISSTNGAIAVNTIEAGAGSAGDVTLTATGTGGAIMDGNGATLNITADVLTVDAATGVGSGDALETTVASLDADNTTSGNIQISETDGIVLTKVNNAGTGDISVVTTGIGDMEVASVDAAGAGATVTLTTNDGAILDDGSDATAIVADGGGSTINLTAGGTNDIGASSGGGTPPLDYVDIDVTNAPVINPIVAAGQSVFLNFLNGDVRSSDFVGAKTELNASAAINFFVDGGSFIFDDTTFDDGSPGTGFDFNLTANDNIAFTAAGPELGTILDVTLTALTGAITDNDTSVDIAADDLVIDAATGVGSGNALETTVATLDIDNSTSGNIEIVETDAVTVAKAVQATAGNIAITAGGTLTVDSGGVPANAVSTLSTGTVNLDANGANADLVINDGIATASGNITLTADDSVLLAAEGDISSTSGAVNVTANADDSAAAGDSGEVITLADGTVMDAGSGTIALSTAGAINSQGGAITLGRLVTTDATAAAVTLTSDDGVIDGGDTGGVDVEAANGGLVIDAATGVGSGGAIDTTVASVDIASAMSGTVEINETDDLALDQVNNGTRAVTLTVGGALTDGGDGNVDIVAGLATIDAVTGVGSGNAIDTTITTADIVNTTSGTVEINETDDLALDQVNNGTRDVALTVGGALTDGGDGNVDIVAGLATIDAVSGVGSGNALETSVESVDIDNTTSGGIDIDNNYSAGAVTVANLAVAAGTGTINFDQTGNVALTVTSATTNDGSITITNTGNAAADTLTATTITAGGSGDINLSTLTRGDITLNGTLTASGDAVTISSVDNATLNSITALDLTVTVDAAGTSGGSLLDLGNGILSITNTISLNGTGSDDNLRAQSGGNTWVITGANTGTLNGAFASFSSFGTISGDDSVDTDTIDQSDASAAAGPMAVVLTGAGSNDGVAGGISGLINFDNIDAVTGTGDGAGDSLTGFSTTATWTINGGTENYLDTVSGQDLDFSSDFSSLNGGGGADTFNISASYTADIDGGAGADDFALSGTAVLTGGLDGGTGDDDFVFSDTARITGNLDGNTGSDSLDFSAYTAATTTTIDGQGTGGDGSKGTVTNDGGAPHPIGGIFDRINTLQGSTLAVSGFVGPDVDTIWRITGVDTGTFGPSGTETGFSDFSLVGGSQQDTFIFEGGSLTGAIDGGTAGEGNTVIADNAGRTITLKGTNSGDMPGLLDTGGLFGTGFFDIDDVFGGNGNDTININSGVSFGGTIGGGLGTDTINYADSATWTITGLGTRPDILTNSCGTPPCAAEDGTGGLVNGNTFVEMETINGTTGVDTFNIQAVSNALTINAGDDNDVFNVSSNAPTNTGNVDGVVGVLTLRGDAGSDSLIVSDISDSTGDTGTMDATTLSGIFGTGGSINYSDGAGNAVEFIGVALGSGNDSFTVTDTSADTNATVINAGTGTDTLTVSGNSSGLTVNGNTGADIFNVTGVNTAELNGNADNDQFNFSADFNGIVSGGLGNDVFTLSVSGLSLTTLAGDGGTDELVASNNATTFNITGNGSGNVDDGVAKNYFAIENLTGGSAADTFNVSASHAGNLNGSDGDDTFNFTAGTLNGTAFGGAGDDDFFLVGGGRAGFIDGDGHTGGDLLDASAATGTVTLGLNSNFTEIESLIGNGSGSILQGDASGASNWNLTSVNGGTLNGITFTGFNTVRSGSGGNNDFSADGDYSGRVNLVGTDNFWNYDAGNTLTNGIVIGTGSLTIGTPAAGVGGNLTVGAGDLLLPDLTSLTGPLFIGGVVSPATTPLNNQAVTINTDILTVSNVITTGGDIVLLGGQINLNTNTMNVGGQMNFVATGNSCSPGVCDDVTTGDGNVYVNQSMTVNADSGLIIAAGGIQNADNLILDFNGGNFQLAVSQAQEESSKPNQLSDAFGIDLTSQSQNFINVLGLDVVASIVNFFNPALQLFALEDISFIDTGLFEEDLSLFGVIGEGIALALAQCEELEGCAPNITMEELDTLIQGIEARVAELERRLESADAATRRELEQLLDGYRKELSEFQGYRKELVAFMTGPSEGDDLGDELGDDFVPGEDELPEADEAPSVAPGQVGNIDTLARMLETIQKRVTFLESLRTDVARRAELAERTGIDLSAENLERIIENTRKEAQFIESLMQNLLEGAQLQRRPKQGRETFSAEAGGVPMTTPSVGYNIGDLSLHSGYMPMDMRWF